MDNAGPAEAVRKRCGKYERNSSNPTAEGFLFFYFKKCNLDRKKSTAAKAGVAAMLPSALHRLSKLCERLVGEKFRLQTQCWHNVDLQCYIMRERNFTSIIILLLLLRQNDLCNFFSSRLN